MRRSGRVRVPAALRIGAAGDDPGAVLGLADGPTHRDGVLWVPVAGRLCDLGSIAPGSVRLAAFGPGADGDLVGAAASLAAVRSAGVLADGAECWLVAAAHRSGPAGRRRLLLDAWGMTEPSDGHTWTGASAGPRAAVEPMGRVLVIGGSASGKSQLAEDLLAASPVVTYLATGPIARPEDDADWAARVRRHQQRRPASWRTHETSDPATVLGQAAEPLLLDSVGSWLTGALDRAGAWDDASGWREVVEQQMTGLVEAWLTRTGPAVAVTDEVGWGVVPATSAGRLFRDLLGRLNQRIADASDRVVVVVAGQVMARAGDGP